MKKTLKKSMAVILATLMLLTAVPLAGFVGLELPDIGLTADADAVNITSYETGDIIEFGWYPQSEVTDSTIIAALNAADGEWVSYNYYSETGYNGPTYNRGEYWTNGNMTASDYMRYKDVLYDGCKYRGVVFDFYRPECTGMALKSTKDLRDYDYDNGYYINTVYWFKYEPIRWCVLDPATGMVMSESLLDSQAYNNYILESGTDANGYTAYWGDSAKSHYANNYEKSSIRAWLNNDFYNTAFSSAQQSIIDWTTIDNSAGFSIYSKYDAASTNDKIYLLSYNDALNTNYGFSDDVYVDFDREARGSAYAICQGLSVVSSWGGSGWMLRSAGGGSQRICRVSKDGYVGADYLTYSTHNGVRPAFNFNLSSAIFQSDVDEIEHSYTCVITPPTCTEQGYTTYTCAHCGDTYVINETAALGHDWDGGVITIYPTPKHDGIITYTCTRCGATRTETVKYEPVTITSYAKGDIIEFGWYPQSEVTDADIIAALNATDGEWISYNYYSGTGDLADGNMTASDYMRYKDVLYNGNKYRGVIFDSYRPAFTGDTPSSDYLYQDENGYNTNTVYWFKYEPIRWRVLDPATGMVLSETILDSQAYNNYILESGTDEYSQTAYWGDSAKTHYANNYEKSSIRAWLNDDFYNTAFSSAQQSSIASTTLDNSAHSTSYSAYDSASTNDKIYLLSYMDSLNTNYGFSSSEGIDSARLAQASAYAKCQGIDMEFGDPFWMLRSAGRYSFCCSSVFAYGWVIDIETNFTSGGVRPALNFNLNSAIFQSDVNESGNADTHEHSYSGVTTAPTCTAQGFTTYTCSVCGGSYIGDYENALGHSEEVIPGTDATCTATGLTEGKKCTVCGTVTIEQTVIPSNGHSNTGVITAPTCTAQGFTTYTCSACGDSYVGDYVNAAGHAEEVIPGKAATCTVTGLTDGKKCTVCGETTVAQTVTAKKEHSKTTINQIPATATEDGYSGDVVCSVCGTEIETGNVIPATGVQDNNCDHLCHKDGFMGFIWKIVKVFWKLFKMNPVCECGRAHY